MPHTTYTTSYTSQNSDVLKVCWKIQNTCTVTSHQSAFCWHSLQVPCLYFFGKPRKIRNTSEASGDVIFISRAPNIIAWRCECVSHKTYFTFQRNLSITWEFAATFNVRLVFLSTNAVGITKRPNKFHHSGCLKCAIVSYITIRCPMHISVVQRSSLLRQKVWKSISYAVTRKHHSTVALSA
jgi:hypothetical protein